MSTKHIFALSNVHLTVHDPASLAIKKTLAKSATAFAISQDGWIAVASGKKVQFFAFKPETGDYVPLAFGKNTEISGTDPITKLGILGI